MSSRIRSSSVGAAPRPKKLFTSRAESAAAAALDVRCACQFFQSTSLLPERINPVGSRPSSSLGYYSRPNSRNQEHIFEPDFSNDREKEPPLGGSEFSFGVVVGDTDYYAESVSSRPNSPTLRIEDPDITAIEETVIGSSKLSLNESLSQRPLKQRDLSTSKLLQRKCSEKSIDLLVHQKDPTTSILLQRRASQRSVDNVFKQRDPSTSSLLRRRLEASKTNLAVTELNPPSASFTQRISQQPTSMPIFQQQHQPQPQFDYHQQQQTQNQLAQPPRPISRGRDFRENPYGEDHYEMGMYQDEQKQEEKEAKTFGIGILDLMALGTNLVQSRKVRYVERSNEDVSRSRKTKRDARRAERAAEKAERAAEKAKKAAELKQAEEEKENELPKKSKQAADDYPSIQSDIRKQDPKNDDGGPSANSVQMPNVVISEDGHQKNIYEYGQTSNEKKRNDLVVDKHFDHYREEPTKAPLESEQQIPPNTPLVFISQSVYVEENPQSAIVTESLKDSQDINPNMYSAPPTVSSFTTFGQKKIEKEVINNSEEVAMKQSDAYGHYDGSGSKKISEDSNSQPTQQTSMIGLALLQAVSMDVEETASPQLPVTNVIHQRDPSQSSLLRKRYSQSVERPLSPEQKSGSQQSLHSQVIKQRDPSQSSLLRKRYSKSMEPNQNLISGSQLSLQSNQIKQKDPATSTLLQKRRHLSRASLHETSESFDSAYNPAEKISKTVSFEFDKQIMAGPYDTTAIGKAEYAQRMATLTNEMRDKMDWIERTYPMR